MEVAASPGHSAGAWFLCEFVTQGAILRLLLSIWRKNRYTIVTQNPLTNIRLSYIIRVESQRRKQK